MTPPYDTESDCVNLNKSGVAHRADGRHKNPSARGKMHSPPPEAGRPPPTMRVLAALILAVAAATASVMPIAPAAPTFIDVYRAPLAEKQYLQPEEEKGIEYLYDQPFVAAFVRENKEVAAYYLQKGFLTIYENPKLAFLRELLLTPKEKVAFYMSAARYLHIPQLALPIKFTIPPPTTTTVVDGKFNENKDMNAVGEYLPFVFVLPKFSFASDLEKLFKVGQFSATAHKQVQARQWQLHYIGKPGLFYQG